MLLGALGSARAGTVAGVALLDRGADRVARATAFAVPTAVPPAGVAPVDELVGGAVDLLLSRTLVAANAATARRADEAYRSVLGLLER